MTRIRCEIWWGGRKKYQVEVDVRVGDRKRRTVEPPARFVVKRCWTVFKLPNYGNHVMLSVSKARCADATCLDATQACLLFQPPPTPPRSTYVYLSFGATENACPCIYLISIIVWVSPSCCVCSLYNEDTAQAALRLANVLLKEINLLWHRKYKIPRPTFNYAHERFILLARILMGPVLRLDV